MTRAEKIQAAIDALPNATGGDWKPDGRVGALSNEDGNVPLAFPITQLRRKNPDGDDIRANLTLISAARELAEEVVRLRGGVRAAIETILTLIGGEPPDPNCSCHVNPPCSDCVDHHYNREALADLRKIALMEDGTCCGNEQRNMGGGCTNCGDPSF
jgi:hypothetical protein